MESLAGAARTLGMIMNGWYSASQEIVFAVGLRAVAKGARGNSDSQLQMVGKGAERRFSRVYLLNPSAPPPQGQ